MSKNMHSITYVPMDQFTYVRFTTKNISNLSLTEESKMVHKAVSRLKSCMPMIQKNFNIPIEYDLDNDLITLAGILLINSSSKAVVQDFYTGTPYRTYFMETIEKASKGVLPEGTKLWVDFFKSDPIC